MQRCGDRHLSHFALYLINKYHNGSAHDDAVKVICTTLTDFYKLIQSEGMYLSVNAKQQLPVVGQRLATLYQKLAEDHFKAKVRMWKLQPKLHLWVHLTEYQAIELGINSAMYWTYPDEDLVRIMIEIAASCHPKTMAMSVLVINGCTLFSLGIRFRVSPEFSSKKKQNRNSQNICQTPAATKQIKTTKTLMAIPQEQQQQLPQ